MQKRILLIIGGGIAAYKSLELIRLIKKDGHLVRVVLTKAAQEFVTPLTCSALSGDQVYSDLFDLKDEAEMGHITLSRQADLVVVAPATADIMARLAHGLAPDLAATLLLATDKPVLMAPAMNVRMWHHRATQRNLATLISDDIGFIGPEEGDMACGEFGLGRMAEPAAIMEAIKARLDHEKPLLGTSIIVTAGPTFEPLDPVRGLTNRSSGKQGFVIAEVLAAAGANVTLISGPVALDTPQGVTRIPIETALDMLAAVEAQPRADVFIGVAAVADWRAKDIGSEKSKKTSEDSLTLTLIKNPDILASLAQHATKRPALVIGFAAETQNLESYARDKLVKKGCDLIYANNVARGVFGADETAMLRLDAAQTTDLGCLSKRDVALDIVHQITLHLSKT